MAIVPDWEDRTVRLEVDKVAADILAAKPGVPAGHQDLTELPVVKESYSPAPPRLSPDRAWVFGCLAYCLVGLDRSLFSLYGWARGKDLLVTSYLADTPILRFEGVDVTANQWFHTIQGIDLDEVTQFVQYIETYQFRNQHTGKDWGLRAVDIRVADPFVKDRKVGVTVTAFLPYTRDGHEVYCSVQPGLMLGDGQLSVRKRS